MEIDVSRSGHSPYFITSSCWIDTLERVSPVAIGFTGRNHGGYPLLDAEGLDPLTVMADLRWDIT
jgi:hypothetical protein